MLNSAPVLLLNTAVPPVSVSSIWKVESVPESGVNVTVPWLSHTRLPRKATCWANPGTSVVATPDCVVSVPEPVIAPLLQLKLPPVVTVISPVPSSVPPVRVRLLKAVFALKARAPEPWSSTMLPLVVCASRMLLVPLTEAVMPLPARRVTVPAAWEMMLLALPR